MVDSARARTLLEEIIRNSEYTLDEWCHRFDRAARESQEKATLSVRQLQRWMAGEVDARPASRRVAAHVWGDPFATLLSPPGAVEPAVSPLAGCQVAAEPAAGIVQSSILEKVAIMAAHESSRHAAESGGSVSMTVVEQVQADVWRLARSYAAMPPLRLLAESRQARNRAYAALDRTNRPGQTRDLYLAAGQLCGLMAVASFDLAVWDAAAEQARAAYVYGELVDHKGLQAWARGTQALVAFWTDQPRLAIVHVEAGLDRAPAGAAAARLRSIEARAWSRIGGDPQRVEDAQRAADDAQASSRDDDELHDEIGGEFGWGASRHAACASTALLGIGDAAGSILRAHQALQLILDDPSAGLVRERALIDLAGAELTLGHLDAAQEALAPAWSVPVPQRRQSLTGRLAQVAHSLSGPQWHGVGQASELRDHIETFNSEAEGRTLLTA